MMTDKDMAVVAATMRSESPNTWKSRLKQAARAYTVPTSRLRPLPEFLIIGAQRTGTTSLYKYLSEHPQFRSATLKTKGVHFFDTRYEKGMAGTGPTSPPRPTGPPSESATAPTS